MASELLKRSEVKEADTWNVKDMYPTTEAWENELKIITGIVDKIASYEGNVTATAENLLIVLEHLANATTTFRSLSTITILPPYTLDNNSSLLFTDCELESLR